MSRIRWGDVAKAVAPLIAVGAQALIESNEKDNNSCPPKRSRKGGTKKNKSSTRKSPRGQKRKR